MDYAFYHLPGAPDYHIVKGEARYFHALPDLDGISGFVMAPFRLDGDHPVVVIPSDSVAVRHLPKQMVMAPLQWSEMNSHSVYRNDFAVLHDLLDKKILDKVVLARRSDIKVSGWTGTPRQLFQKACWLYPRQATVLVCASKTGSWLMSTPELLLGCDGDRWQTMALAGTLTPDMARQWSVKDRREQDLVAQYISDTLEPLAEDVKKGNTNAVRAGSLYHLRTDFTFRLRDGVSVGSLVEALHPTPAVCGLPKDRAMGAIARHESIDRRYYSGFCGPWNIGGESRLYVSLRCMEMRDRKNFSLYAGGGLLEESEEQKEWKETEAKMQTMRDIITSRVSRQRTTIEDEIEDAIFG